jgi:hypothetical protein
MTLLASIDRLHRDLQALGHALGETGRRALDTPRDRELHLAQTMADEADTMGGWVAEAAERIVEAKRGLLGASEPGRLVHEQLTAAQRRIIRIGRQLDELVSYDRVADIVAAGGEGGASWRDWALDVRDALEGCRALLRRVEARFFSSWQELSEPGVARQVSVRTASIGQLSVTHRREDPDAAAASENRPTSGGANHG